MSAFVGENHLLTPALEEAMRGVFGGDAHRIDHALAVLGHARSLLKDEGGDPVVVTAAALLHDIGIGEAERKHNSAAGKYQEIEGPPIARRIMAGLGMDEDAIDHICRIVGSHHTGRDIDTVEFRVLWDADWLVNLPDVYPDMTGSELEGVIDRVFRTAAGRRTARVLFL